MRIEQQKGFVLWFTGLSGSGKSTLANAVKEKFEDKNKYIEVLDGDEVRENLTKDLGFSKEDRDENIRRISYVCKLLSRNGVGVITAFISPYCSMRDYARGNSINFIEIHVSTPLKVCEERDVKGLYKKARNGEIEMFTGVSDPYEPPENPEIEINTAEENFNKSVEKIINYLQEKGLIEK